MIKFFRHIRKSLIQKNQMGKYLKYAIGEIVLVVIGILIALQINNWNENRRDKKKEQTYLVNLKKDIADDIDFLQGYVLNRYSKKVEVLEKAKAFYQGKYKIKDTILFLNDVGYGNVFGNVNYAFSNTTYDQLVSTGDFNVIQSDSLKASILNYYRILNATSAVSKQKPSGYIKFTNSLAPFNRNKPNYISDFDSGLFIAKIRSEEFYRLVNLELTLAHDLKDNAEIINQRANQLISLISTQIDD